MVNEGDTQRWLAFGGTIDTDKSRKVYLHNGKRLRSWKEAERFMKEDLENESGDINNAEQEVILPAKKAKVSKICTEKEDAAVDVGDIGSDDTSTQRHVEPSIEIKRNIRAATVGVQYKEAGTGGSVVGQRIHSQQEGEAENEEEALKATGGDSTVPAKLFQKRRLLSFSIADKGGDTMALQRVNLEGCNEAYLSGTIYPAEGNLSKDRGRCLKVPMGPVTSWSIDYTATPPLFRLCTSAAEYTVSRPAPTYRAAFVDIQEQAALASHVATALVSAGDKELGLDGILAALNRAKVVKGYRSIKDAVILNGAFLISQAPSMQAAAGPRAGILADSAFFKDLKEEVKKGPPKTLAEERTAGIVIQEGGATPLKGAAASGSLEIASAADADEEFARRLQAKLDAAEFAQASRGGAKQPKGGIAYIKISEEEIADDYPLPRQYQLEEEELDELLVNGDEDMALDIDPECLPKLIIDDFAAYNAEGFMSTLELLPMWQNVDTDLDLFGSGCIREPESHESEWLAGHPLAGEATVAEGQAPALADAAGSSGTEAGPASSTVVAGSSGPAGPSGTSGGVLGVRVFLSQIKEWLIEYTCDMLFIVIRTDSAWYKVRSVAAAYGGWFAPILKAARLAVHLLGEVQAAPRSSRLSFADIVKHLAALPLDSPVYLSSRSEQVERFLVVHGQIILNQFKNFPIKAVQNCAFVSTLRQRMQSRRHSKLYLSKRKITVASKVGRKANPMRGRAPVSRPKAMTATATNLVKAVWMDYFSAAMAGDGDEQPTAKEVEDDDDAEEEEEDAAGGVVEVALTETAASPSKIALGRKHRGNHTVSRRVVALSEPLHAPDEGKPATDAQLFRAVAVGDEIVCIGDIVELEADEDDDEDSSDNSGSGKRDTSGDCEHGSVSAQQLPLLGLVQCLWRSAGMQRDAEAQVQVRVMVHGAETVLGDAASSHEIFMAPSTYECPVSAIICRRRAQHLKVEAGPLAARDAAIARVEEILSGDKENADGAGERQLLYRMAYLPEEGMFRLMPEDLGLGCYQHVHNARDGLLTQNGTHFTWQGQEYRLGDFVYLLPRTAAPTKGGSKAQASKARGKRKGAGSSADDDDGDNGSEFEADTPSAKSGKNARESKAARPQQTWKASSAAAEAGTQAGGADVPRWLSKYQAHDLKVTKGDLDGLSPYLVGQILSIDAERCGRAQRVGGVTVRAFARPEDVGAGAAYDTDVWTVYATPERLNAELSELRGRCTVVLDSQLQRGAAEVTKQVADVFFCAGTLEDGKVSGAPADLSVKGGARPLPVRRARDDTAAGKPQPDDGIALKTLDIFAGCGGLSEGMHQAGAAVTKWAIEYWKPAADAFEMNNPAAHVYNGNCNVLLHRAMVKAGAEAQCSASAECLAESAALDAGLVATLPLPGDVEFICGGPPCQGYSGMNRFNKGNWSMVQNSMVMAYLSYCDFYRPRYWLLENVRNFVSHNKSFTFRLTLRTLLEMGYQVRFGVLNAGNFGVSQSRKRTFIWAAAPGEALPEWPRPLTVFKSPQLCVNLPGGIRYQAIPESKHARLRAVTVRDAIRDLPAVCNGDDMLEKKYGSSAVSTFQRDIRGGETTLRDHICKAMNELNLRRCSLIPKNTPGADWRALVLHVRDHPEDESFNGQKLIPWCLPNTAERHNGWRGLYGRLNWNGHFPTSVTDPNPMGKVGQVFHPEQDRIVSVRECARAQGFPDRFLFAGNVHDKHKEVGNAVPPPLAAALGRMLRKRLDEKAERAARDMLAHQFAY